MDEYLFIPFYVLYQHFWHRSCCTVTLVVHCSDGTSFTLFFYITQKAAYTNGTLDIFRLSLKVIPLLDRHFRYLCVFFFPLHRNRDWSRVEKKKKIQTKKTDERTKKSSTTIEWYKSYLLHHLEWICTHIYTIKKRLLESIHPLMVEMCLKPIWYTHFDL